MCDIDKLNFLSVSKKNHAIKNLISFNDKVHMTAVMHLWYYNSFFNIDMCKTRGQEDLEISDVAYPKNITHLRLHNRAQTINIPPTVTDLIYYVYVDRAFDAYVPDGIKNLTFVCPHSDNIRVKCIPNSVTHLAIINNDWDQINNDRDIKKYVPKSVTTFTISYILNLGTKIPDSVTDLRITDICNDSWDGIPNSVKTLHINRGKIPQTIPTNLTHLTIGSGHNTSLASYNFDSLTHLSLGSTFNQKINLWNIPYTITHLTLGNSFNKSIKYCNPDHIQSLILGDSFNQPFDIVCPSLTFLQFGRDFNQHISPNQIPNVTHLNFGYHFNQDIIIPKTVTHLTFGDKFNKYLNRIPDSVTHLTVGYYFKFDYHVRIPKNIISLTYSDLYDRPIDNVLNAHIKFFKFGRNFSCPLPSHLLSHAMEILLHRTYALDINTDLYQIISIYS